MKKIESKKPLETHKKLPCGKLVPLNIQKFGACLSIDLLSRLRLYLQQRGLRMTTQRQRIINHLITHSQHKTAPQIAQIICKLDSSIGAATVFRSLNLLCDADVLVRNRLPITGDMVYEVKSHSEEVHHHIVCLDCNEIFEFDDDSLSKISGHAIKKEGFDMVEKPIVLYGQCQFKHKR